MHYQLRLDESLLASMSQGMCLGLPNESAGMLFCAKAEIGETVVFLGRSFTLFEQRDIFDVTPQHVSINGAAIVRGLAHADREDLSFFLVHSHPCGPTSFSSQDDEEETSLFRTAYIRAENGLHGSLIITQLEQPHVIGRVWTRDGHRFPIERVSIVGARLKFQYPGAEELNLKAEDWADRQIRIFGRAGQQTLKTLKVGVVGAGGTGSSVCEQLLRLGVGELLVIDKDKFDPTNINRVYGSRLSDAGLDKVEIVRRQALSIGTNTDVKPIAGSITNEDVAKHLRQCDIVFGCTDDYWGRVILSRIAYWYLVPVIDMGVSVDAHEGNVQDIIGRITIMRPGSSCLRCRGRILQDKLEAQILSESAPERHLALAKEGYVAGLNEPAPSVIPLTTATSAKAVLEFLHLLFGILGPTSPSEILEQFRIRRTATNSTEGEAKCYCTDRSKWSQGDTRDFIGMQW